MVEFPQNRLQHCVVRDNICYGYSGRFLCAIDPRANPAVVFNVYLDFDTSPSNQAVLNVYDNHIYTAHDLVEIFDMRMMNQSRKSPTEIVRHIQIRSNFDLCTNLIISYLGTQQSNRLGVYECLVRPGLDGSGMELH